MKKFLLFIISLMYTISSFSQVEMNIWDKSPQSSKSLSKIKSKSLPLTFSSKTPDGVIVYEKMNLPTVEVVVSDGKKFKHKQISYKSQDGRSIVTYGNKGWIGYQETKSGEFYSMTPSKIGKDSLSEKLYKNFCGSGSMTEPTEPKKTVPKVEQTVPQVSQLITSNGSADFYDVTKPINKVITQYVEVSYDLHQMLGGDPQVTTDWITNLYTAITAGYQREGLTVLLNKIYIWQTIDPYGYSTISDSYTALSTFTDNIYQNLPVNPNSTHQHLLTGKSYGGIAWVGGNSNGYMVPNYFVNTQSAVSGMGSGLFYGDPLDLTGYRWPIYVVLHELGHNLGSKHTQWCGWRNDQNVNIGRLDSCYTGEEGSASTAANCSASMINFTKDVQKPTIMSYCHFQVNGRNNMLNFGFGKYPAFAIRSTVYFNPYIPFANVTAPTVSTTSVTSIGPTTAVSGGNVTGDGGGFISDRGVVWSTSQNPTVSLTTKLSSGTGSGAFVSNLTGLTANTTYYIRSYAVNSFGVAYGNQITFTTTPPTVPSLTTTAVSGVGSSTAVSGGNVTSTGGATVTSRGVVWSTSPLPTVALTTKTSNGTGTGTFTSNLTGLTPSTTYYLRSYATNSVGTNYGDQLTFTTLASGAAVVVLEGVYYTTSYRIAVFSNVTNAGGTVTSRGVCYNTSGNPTTSGSKIVSGSGLGQYESYVEGLSPNTTYYFRSYCVTSAGTFYSDQITSKTDVVPSATLNTPTQITFEGATFTWNVTGSFQRLCYEKGIQGSDILISTNPTPTRQNSIVSFSTTSNQNLGTNIKSFKFLPANTTLYARPCVVDCNFQDFLGNIVSFKTAQGVAPTVSSFVTSNSFDNTGVPTASAYVEVTANGIISSSGVIYKTTPNLVIGDPTVTSYQTDAFGRRFYQIPNVQANTNYYVRFFCTNQFGTTYSDEKLIAIGPNPVPVVKIDSVRTITNKGAIFYGTITSAYNCVNSSGCIKIGISSTNTTPYPNQTEGPTSTQTTVYLKPNKQTVNGTFSIDFRLGDSYMQPNTTYYAMAMTEVFYVSSDGITNLKTGYSPVVTFKTTNGITTPIVSTNSTTSITTSSATSGGNVTSDGGSPVTERGIVWSTSTNPTTSLATKLSSGTGTGSFSANITGLSANTTYYVRSYAINSVGTSYGLNVTFTTSSSVTAPVLTTNAVTSLTSTSATTGGNITSNGGATVTARGICYSTTSTLPSLTNATVLTSGTGNGSYSINITGLTTGTTYYVRSYATNSVGTNYGSTVTFVTLKVPTVTTTSITAITSTTATGGGNVTSAGGGTITERGVCYGTVLDPTPSDAKIVNGSTTIGSFTSNLINLTPGTLYYVRAYAVNEVGIGYGTSVSFTSSQQTTLPTLTTTAVTSITTTGASSGGTITSDGNASIIQKGVVWSTNPTPTVDLTTKTSQGSGTASFTSTLNNLSPNVTYYVRSYATNSAGTGYGDELTFQTTTSLPTLSATSAITSITQTSAVSGGTVTSDGGLPITARGVVWSTSQTPNISLTTKTNDGTGTGSFVSNLTGLIPGTIYYVRSYATNANGTDYGTQLSFTTTASVVKPVLTTTNAINITQTGATTGGNISSDGGAAVTSRGVVWSTSPNPTISLTTKTSNGTGTGSFTSQITGLTASTTYYYRAYATNSAGTEYGNQLTFITQANIPSLTTTAVNTITLTSAKSGGNITSDGGASIISRGVVWSTSPGPTVVLTTKTSNGTGVGSFTSDITGLTQNTTYYLRSYATNSSGTGYGNEVTFTTQNTSIPTVQTTSPTSVQFTNAVSGGNVVSDGNLTVTSRGVVWSTTTSPNVSLSTKTNDGTGTGVFSSSVTGLVPGTTYYIRAYATNSLGTGYGSEFQFNTTPGESPTITTDNITNVSSTNANVTFTVVSIGGGVLTEKGFVYSTTPTPTTSNTKVGGPCGVQNPCDIGQYTTQFITSLTPATTYYVRAYAINQFGTSYGQEITFTTAVGLPSVTTRAISNITTNSAISGGESINPTGGNISEKGIVWSTQQNPTISLSTKTNDGFGTSTYTSTLNNLQPNTVYYVRAYVTNQSGTGYGNQVTFTTSAVSLPTLTTNSVVSISTNSATCGGIVNTDGGSSVTSRGVVWSTSQNPTISDNKTSDGVGLGSFSSSITGLSPGTLYYVRAYATTIAGTGYGPQQQFTTSGSIPSLSTNTVSSITSTSAISGGNITSTGGASITQRGVVWSTSQTPTISLGTKTTEGPGTVGSFSSSITGLSPSTTYYVRSYATNSAGTGYGSERSFTTTSSGGGGNCGISNLTVTRTASPCTGACTPTNTLKCPYTFSFNINGNCDTYTVKVCRYSNTNPSVSPVANQVPAACAVRNGMTNYTPSQSEITSGVITRLMDPPPAFGCAWYSVDVTCNSLGCGTTTRSAYFYNAP